MDELNLNDYCDEDEFTDLRKQEWYELRAWLASVVMHQYNGNYEKFFEEYDNLKFVDLFDLKEEDYSKAEKSWQGEIFVDGHLVYIIDFVEK